MFFLQEPAIPAVSDAVPDKAQELSMLKNLPLDELLNKLVSGMVTFAINLAIAIAVFYVGKFIINKIYTLVHNILLRRRIDSSLSSFVLSFVRMVLYFILIVTVIGILGIETSSFIAIFASAGVAIGMALSGTLQNFAGGVLILLLKPYKVGDFIETQGYTGTVKEIQIFHTLILTPDNKSIVIPNGGLSTGTINNYSREDYRRVDWSVGISYGDSVEVARKALMDIMLSDERVVRKYVEDDREGRKLAAENNADEQEPDETAKSAEKKRGWFKRMFKRKVKAVVEETRMGGNTALSFLPPVDRSPSVVVESLGDSSVVLKARAWTHTANYWSVFYEINERIYTELPDSGISFPFPQLDVHLPSK
ncbi:MAG: mechanosensitive ion channel [Muribaculaceae bacterium]|nr:mechanosensitive ion channel [Muribaculaceae bacterium]